MYFLARRGKKTYHIPSDELKAFKAEMHKYPLIAGAPFLLAKTRVQGWITEGRFLEINTFFFFKHEKLFTKANKPRKLDTSNRIKGLHDSLASILEIDDKYFFKIIAEKVETETNSEGVWAEIVKM